ncbi:roadblock/LC7 domain-containing protein [Planctomycetota bacterium]
MTIRDEDLRKKRVVFYEKHITKIKDIVVPFLEKSKTICAMLVDKEGHLIYKEGEASVDAETISALVAASFAATQQIAKLLGEEEFSVLFHQGKTDSIQLTLVGDRMLLVVVFDQQTTPGMVRLYADQAVIKLNKLMIEIHESQDNEEAPQIAEEFSAEADDALDDVFG